MILLKFLRLIDLGSDVNHNFDQWLHKIFADKANVQELFLNGNRSVFALLDDGSTIDLSLTSGEQHFELVDSLQTLAFTNGSRLDPISPSAGGDMSFSNPRVDLRWHVILPPLSRDGPAACFRRINHVGYQLKDFLPTNTSYPRNEFDVMMASGSPVFLAGQTGSGKTSLLTALLSDYCLSERLILIEELAELHKLSNRWVRLISRGENIEGRGEVTMSKLLNETLRLRPDRVVLGEVREQGARALFRTMQTTNAGVLSTIHASSPSFLVTRLSEISNLSASTWRTLFRQLNPYYLQLQRNHPRLSEMYRFDSSQMDFKLIFSFAQT